MTVSYLSAFIAGLLTFLAPCTLPLVPGFLAYISGASAHELRKNKKIQIGIFLHGLAFVFGFTLVFVGLGMLVGVLGAALQSFQVWLTRIGGIVVILFGLQLVGVLSISFFEKTKRFNVASVLTKGKYLSAFLFGASFAVGWSPCVGPILGAILLLASASRTAITGGLLLFAFSVGLALPFLFVSLVSGFALQYIQKISSFIKYFSVIGGLLLVLIGILMLFDSFELLITWGYRLFDFINYDALLNYL
jgi:cytochrome c-type biogenesis protein